MLPAVAETETLAEKPRRWSAFVCPECRFVFRVPRDHDGEGIVCPSCRRMLRLPGEGDKTAPLIAPLKKIPASTSEPEISPRTHKSRKKRAKGTGTSPWSLNPLKRSSAHSKRANLIKMIIGILLAATVITAIVMFFIREQERELEKSGRSPGDPAGVESFEDLIDLPAPAPKGGE